MTSKFSARNRIRKFVLRGVLSAISEKMRDPRIMGETSAPSPGIGIDGAVGVGVEKVAAAVASLGDVMGHSLDHRSCDSRHSEGRVPIALRNSN